MIKYLNGIVTTGYRTYNGSTKKLESWSDRKCICGKFIGGNNLYCSKCKLISIRLSAKLSRRKR